MFRQRTLLALFVAYLAFIVYGSLIPFDVRPHNLDQALERFGRIPWLQLDATSRADWVANLVLYVPLAFLGCSALAGYARSRGGRLLATLLVLAVGLATAVAVEFTQIFFAPRTVSLNDLLAETLGTLVGIGLWLLGRERLARLGQDFRSGGRRSIVASIVAYLAVYVALAMFPYDFVISWNELASRLASGNVAWLLAGGGLFRTSAGLFAEMVTIAPLGLLAALLTRRTDLARAFMIGAGFGLVLELMQLLLVSGVTQGASVISRGLGLAAGALVGQLVRAQGLMPVARWVRRIALPLSPAYLASLAAVSGWFSNETLGTAEALARFDTVQLIPFYFHYFTTEPVALASLLANLLMYAPVGLYVWAHRASVAPGRWPGAPAAAAAAVLLALAVEVSKLWLAGKHPDFTNLLISAAGATLSYALATWVALVAGHPSHTAATDVGGPSPADAFPAVPRAGASRTAGFRPAGPTSPRDELNPGKIAALLFFAIALAGLALHPLVAWIVPLLLAYGVVLWRFPASWLLLLPLLLPVLDLAPYSGRLVLDEFDLLILSTLGLGYWRNMARPPAPWANDIYPYAVLLLLASGLIAAALGLKPVLEGAPLSLDSSHPALDAVMVGKGLFWALLLVPLLRRIQADELAQARRLLLAGLAGGLALLALVVTWERHRFVGLADFDGIFRVTGNFSSMNNGGAYIEAFIASSFPALVVWTLQQSTTLLRVGGVAAAALASYAMFVTFSRGGYAGLAVGLLFVVLANGLLGRRRSVRNGPWLAALTLAAVAAAMPVLLGGFAQGRLAQIQSDLSARVDHWRHVLDLMEPGILTPLVGMGFGRYPTVYLWHADGARAPGTFAVEHEQGQSFLRLGAGQAYYLDQIVGLEPADLYSLQARVRFHGDRQSVRIFLCEKALLYSFSCTVKELRRPDPSVPGQWAPLTTELNTAVLSDTGRWPEPTLKLSIGSPGGEGLLDIDDLSLQDAQGRELLSNGGFDEGLAHWLSATDQRLAWHIDQTLLEIFFAQGLLGVLSVLTALYAAARALLPPIRRGDPLAVAIGGGLAGFLTVGLLGSTMDTARTSLLFYLLILGCGVLFREAATDTRPRRRPVQSTPGPETRTAAGPTRTR